VFFVCLVVFVLVVCHCLNPRIVCIFFVVVPVVVVVVFLVVVVSAVRVFVFLL